VAQALTITAVSCSSPDVQAAINSAVGGDTVVIPNGSCTWTSGVTLSGKGILLQGQSQSGVVITNNANPGIAVTEDTTRHTEIKQMTVSGSSSSYFIRLLPHASPNDDGKAVLVHDLIIHDTGGVRAETTRGVIYSNTVTGLKSLNANIEFIQCKPGGLTSSWTTASTMGTADTTGESNLYVEDNTFTKVLQAVLDPDDNCRIVIRHNTFDNSAMASHGADTSTFGNRHLELYDNTFIFTNHGDCDGSQTANVPYFIFLRGGTGVITDNTGLQNMSSCAWGNKPALNMTVMNLQRNAGPNPCWGINTSGGAKYHAPRQIGFGYVTGRGTDGNGRTNDQLTYVGDSEPLYIWNQSFTPVLSDYGSEGSGGGCTGTPDVTKNYLVSGRDYFVGTAKPGYAKYTYPHPLRSGAMPPPAQLAAPTNLRVQ
jgi:hypothetical protein